MEDKTLEAVIKLKDEMSKQLEDIIKSLEEVQKVTKKTSNELSGLQRVMSKIKPLMLAVKDKATPVLNKVKGLLNKIMNTKVMLYVKDKISPILKKIKNSKLVLTAKDKISPIVNKVKGILKSVTSKAWSAMLVAKDKATPILNKVKGILKTISGKAYSAMVKVKDMASSVLSKIKGMLVGLAAGVTIGVKVGLEGLVEEQNNKITIDRVLKNAGLKDYKKVGEEYYKYLEDYANKTPFTTSEMATAGTKAMMMAKGDTSEAKQILDMIANTKAFVGDNRTMQEVIEAYFSAKNGNMESLNNILGENFTSFEQAQKEVLDKYGGLVDEQSKTLGGLWSTMKGKIQTTLKDMMKPFEGLISGGMTNIIGFLDNVGPKLTDFAQKVADGFKAFSESETASNLLQLFKTVAETVWNAIKAVIDAVSPTIKEIFIWIGDHAEQIKGIIEKLGNIWEDVWGIVGPLLEDAWAIIKPILGFMFDAIDKVLGVVESLTGAFKRLADAFRNKDVQNALSNSNAANGNNTYQGTLNRAMGQMTIPRDNTLINAHRGEMLLTARDARQYRKGQDNSTITIAKIADTVVIREEADINKITAGIVRKINQQKIVTF